MARAPLTPWILEDGGIDHVFPLARAYAAAMDASNYPEGQETLPDYLQRRPDAYLAFAWSFHTEDSQGTAYPLWALVWTDGHHLFERAVSQYPSLVIAEPGILPPSYAIEEWESGFDDDSFPSPGRLPATLPTLAALWGPTAGLLESALGHAPNSYGFWATCVTADCLAPLVLLHAGYTWMPAAPFGLALDATFQDQTATFGLVAIDQDGQPLLSMFLHGKQQAPVPVLPPTEQPPASAPGNLAAASATTWTVPPAEAVAGVGLLASLAAAAYYFWPAAKGSALGLFSRIQPDRVLEHPSRKMLYALVEANPGIHFQDLARRSGFGRGQLEHHLRKLQAADLVSRVQGSSYACFFARGQVDRRVMAAAPLLRSEGGRSILGALNSTPGASSRELAGRLGLAPGTVSYHVKRLREAGLLESAGGALHLTETGRRATGLAA